ncbi:NfeD family protein [Nocardioides insulae]|uniref:NfeD family protein n=1 Tax=Nocardioides insulae TaxID=394734 RepID=UPI000419809F|nr:NfeD family protein [Nocardioides insulae]
MTVFMIIGLVGLGILLVSLIAGDLLDGVFDALSADWFSSAALGGFVAALGFGGGIADALGAPPLVTGAVGVAAGAVAAWFALWLTRLLKGDTGEGTTKPEQSLGHDATVLTAIPAEGFGIVRVRIGGHSVQYNAKLDPSQTDGSAIEPGTPVYVTGVLSPTAVTVAPSWRELP